MNKKVIIGLGIGCVVLCIGAIVVILVGGTAFFKWLLVLQP